jgi:hypothetical protein
MKVSTRFSASQRRPFEEQRFEMRAKTFDKEEGLKIRTWQETVKEHE